MNVREGMRRLGILLGVSGGILGGCVAYNNAKAAWDSYTAHRKFVSMMASPTVQKVAKAARDYQNAAWAKYRQTTVLERQPQRRQAVVPDKWAQYEVTTSPAAAAPGPAEPDGSLISVNLDGIKQVAVDKTGLISSIELENGESAIRTEAPHVKAYLAVLLYPMLGFLLPWGGVRVLTWVASGFFQPPQ